MSPSKFQDSDVTKRLINGPLRINKDSHLIHKPPPNPSSHQHPTDAAAAKSHGQPEAKRQPVIIYTHSPRVIRAKANDFMKIVQTLTGAARDNSRNDKAVISPEGTVKEEAYFPEEGDGGGVDNNNVGYVENNETTSVFSDDQRFMGDVNQDSAVVSPMTMYEMSNTFSADSPLYTPNPSAFLTSSLFQPPNMAASSISPSFMDYMKAFPEY